MNLKCKICKDNNIEHNYLKMCSMCYCEKRRNDWSKNEKIRLSKDINRKEKRKKYCNDKYHELYRLKRLVKKKCIDCSKLALKGSHYSQCKECSKKRSSKNKVKYQLDRKKTHLPTKIRNMLSGRLKDFLKSKNKKKDKSIVVFLGCSIPDFIIYMENLFTEGMTWENQGKWHIDHIKPISKFNPNCESDLLKMSHYTNLQPLWAKDNLKKGAKYES